MLCGGRKNNLGRLGGCCGTADKYPARERFFSRPSGVPCISKYGYAMLTLLEVSVAQFKCLHFLDQRSYLTEMVVQTD